MDIQHDDNCNYLANGVCVFALQNSESHKVCKESNGQRGEDVAR